MDILGSGDVGDLSEIRKAIRACLNEDDDDSEGDDTSDVEEFLDQSKPTQKCLDKCASFPSAVPSSNEDDELETAFQRMSSEDSVQSPYSRSISLPSPSKLVSALKGSREKQGLAPRKLSVTWAPDVYDPPPTTVLHTVRGKKQQKSRKNNDKKKNGKKQKGNNSSRGNGGGKDKKQFRRGSGFTDRFYKPLEIHDTVSSPSGDLDGFNVGSPDPYCGSSFLKNSPTRMHYSVAEAL